MRFIIVDLEATCRESGMPRTEMEIIEIGAVELGTEREFVRFVRPQLHPELSAFCTELTHITQEQVDRAEPFPPVFADFLAWIGPEPYQLCSWGAYDRSQLLQDCARHGIAAPDSLTPEQHINLKQRFSEQFAVKPMGMAGALNLVGLPLLGQHHRGIDDARNIAALARLLLAPDPALLFLDDDATQ